jgi:phosphohistidine phosphatase
LPKDLPDAERPLTDKGREKLQTVARAMQAMELEFGAVLSSPLLRARQTGQAIIDELHWPGKLALTDHLAPQGSPKSLVEQINHLSSRTQDILVVGHEPYLSKLIELFTTGHTNGGIELKKGGLAKLEADKFRYGRCAILCWLLAPKQMSLMK